MGKLIRLELFNFKSYKGHHTLLFGDSYFTSIVGPNGSGKSNSMDAISFVLGIKSSQLRSSQLRDLVYRGRVMKTSKIQDDGTAAPATNGHTNGVEEGDEDESSHRAARGDPKTAWVMAVYEDDAGDEQKWKRSITSSGSSEYRINDRVVTAQQYNEALEAENILIKARNFLVFQGDVEAIASQSPHDLTRLIEQISGSLEYKAEFERLQAAEAKAMEEQQYNFNRRRGINSEMRQYLEQKKEAENYQKKVQERDDAIIAHILWKLYHFQRVMDESSAQIQEHQENLKEFRRNVEVFEKKLEAARKEQSSIGREVGKIERGIKSKERSIEDRENSLVPIDEKISQNKQDMAELRKKIGDVKKLRETQVAKVEKLKKELETVEKNRQKEKKELAEKLRKQGKELTDADRKELTALEAEAMRKTTANQSELTRLSRDLKNDEVTVSNLKGSVENLESTIDKLQTEIEAIKSHRESCQDVVQKLSSEIDAKKKEFSKMQSDRTRFNNKYNELTDKFVKARAELEEQESKRQRDEREQKTQAMIRSLKGIYPGVRGRVGDLCRPKQNKWDEAVITALGMNFDSVIVDTEKIGMDCIQYLKAQKFPPITFIPLDNIKVNASNSAVKGIAGARPTIDAIDFDQSLERAIAYACEGSVICDTKEICKDIAYKRKIPVKTVSLEGMVIHKAGTLTGGRMPTDKGGRRRFEANDNEIERLQNMVTKYREELEKLPKLGRQGDAAEESLKNEIVSDERRLEQRKSELVSFDRNLKDKQKELDKAKRELKEYLPMYEKKNKELKSTRAKVDEFRTAINEVQNKIFAGFCKRLGYENIQAYYEQQGSLEDEATKKRQDYEVHKGRIENYLNLEKELVDGSNTRIKTMQESMSRHHRDTDGYEQEKADIEKGLGEDQDELEALQETLEEARGKHAEKSKKVAEAKQDLDKRKKDIDGRLNEISELEAIIQKQSSSKLTLLRRCKLEQVQIPLNEGSLDDVPNDDVLLHKDQDAMDIDGDDEDADAEVLEAALDDYGIDIDFDKLDEDLKDSDDNKIEEKLQEKIASINAELEKLNPNMRAGDRLEDVRVRLETTEKDWEDSKNALKTVRDSFNEVKTKRKDLFMKAFEHIKQHIDHVYRELTRTDNYPLGGQAYLDVEDDTDTPFLSGVKYHAMPPLKRFRDMDLLSGGEKTMAALALLFAIHSYQPSPFFVLDEVDAALDNANVGMIKKYIREHAGPGMQFIVISLKPGLFQDSESLVGVYRDQDVNSSRTLTLDLRKYT
ncbi:hypothetical protein OQA88_13581 [Cercophora sp. LCS_1]